MALALPPPIRVTILTGFLGAGKTTLLNRLLRDPALEDTAVVVNEFGEAGIDHLLVEAASRDGVIELSGGCLCCSVRGDLVDTLADLVDRLQTGRIKALKRVVIETTGLADPTPVLAALMGHPILVQAFALDGVVAVVDALAGPQALRDREEARRQVAVADRIVVTKTDLAEAEPLAAIRECIRAINPRAPVLEAAGGEAGAAALLDCGLMDAAGRADPQRWLLGEAARDHEGHDHHHHHHAHGEGRGRIASFSILHDAPLAEERVYGFLDLLGATAGPGLLRMKAIVWTAESPSRPLVLHGVRGYFHPPARLPDWPAGVAPHTRLVVIGEALAEEGVRDLFAAFAGAPRTDAPDHAALTDNPLAVPGLRL